jgi:hypothetical protein
MQRLPTQRQERWPGFVLAECLHNAQAICRLAHDTQGNGRISPATEPSPQREDPPIRPGSKPSDKSSPPPSITTGPDHYTEAIRYTQDAAAFYRIGNLTEAQTLATIGHIHATLAAASAAALRDRGDHS